MENQLNSAPTYVNSEYPCVDAGHIKNKTEILVGYATNTIFDAAPLLREIFGLDPEQLADDLDDLIFDYIQLISASSENSNLHKDQAEKIYYLKTLRDALRRGVTLGEQANK